MDRRSPAPASGPGGQRDRPRRSATRQLDDEVVDSGRLAISQYTVQEHLRAVFDKPGVRSRQELAAALMRTHH